MKSDRWASDSIENERHEMSEEDGWSTEEIQEAVDELVLDIGKGYYDDHIRVIARACFKRRDVTTGSHTVVSINDEDANTIVDHVPDQKATTQQYGGQTMRVALTTTSQVLPVPPHKRVHNPNDVVTIGSKRFYKHDFMGKVFDLPRDIQPVALQGCTLLITGLGDKTVKTEIITRPTSKRGKYFQMYQDKTPLFLQKNALMPYCNFGN